MKKKTAVRATISIGWGALFASAYYQWLNIPPAVEIPSPRLPSPNGFDELTAAGKLVVRKSDIYKAMTTHVDTGARLYTIADKAALVAANYRALSAAKIALSLPFVNPPDPTGRKNFHTLTFARSLAQLFSIRSEVEGSSGNISDAVQSDIDAVAIGIAVPRGGAITGQFVGNLCESIGYRSIWPQIEKLDAAGAASAARRLGTLIAQRTPFAQLIRQEECDGLANYRNEFARKSTFRYYNEQFETLRLLSSEMDQISKAAQAGSFSQTIAEPTTAEKISEWKGRADAYSRLFVHSKRRIVSDYTAAMDGYIAEAEAPFAAPKHDIPVPNDPINVWMVPTYRSARFQTVQVQAEGGLLTCAFALRGYRLKYGDYPVTLADLVTSGILSKSPDDPFARVAGAPFGYRRVSADKYVLYSVGPDGIDNGGKPIAGAIPVGEKSSRNPTGHWITETDKGDWVVGDNLALRSGTVK